MSSWLQRPSQTWVELDGPLPVHPTRIPDDAELFPKDLTAAEWDESLHPRDERGRFGEGGGGPAARDQLYDEDGFPVDGPHVAPLRPIILPEDLASLSASRTAKQVQAAATKAGLRYVTMQTLDPRLRAALQKADHLAEPTRLTAAHELAMGAARQAMEQLNGIKAYREALHPLDIGVLVADFEPRDTMAEIITHGFAGTPLIIYNSAMFDLETWWGATVPGNITQRRVGEMIAAGRPHEETAKEMFRLITLHEIGHAVDDASHGALTNTLIGEASDYAHLGQPGWAKERDAKVSAWLGQHISLYAGESPKEAAAEAFALLMDGVRLPAKLDRWAETVPGAAAYKTKHPLL